MKTLRISATMVAIALVSALVACSSGGSVGSPFVAPPTSNPGPTSAPPTTSTIITSPPISVNSTIVHAEPDIVNGSRTWYSGGVTAFTASAGATASGATGSNTIDGVSCAQMGEPLGNTQLHAHAFLGLYVNGSQEAIPSAIGMKQPAQPTPDTMAISSASCYYNVHTHDYSGLVHIEDSSMAQSYTAMPSYAKLTTLFDLWGEPLNANTVATFNGPVAMYIGTPTGTKSLSGAEIVTSYAPFNGDLTTIQLGHHVAAWIVVGTPPSSGLPQVEFDVEN